MYYIAVQDRTQTRIVSVGSGAGGVREHVLKTLSICNTLFAALTCAFTTSTAGVES